MYLFIYIWKDISCPEYVINKEVLHSVKEKRNVLYTLKTRMYNCVGHVIERNSFLKYGSEVAIGRE